jgi:hypothetical protein
MAVPDFSLTKWIDPLFGYFATQSGIPIEEYAAVAGGEGIGAAEEVIVDMLCTGLLGKIIQLATGLGCTLGAIYSKDLSQRLKRELIVWGQHSITRLIDPTPSDLLELRANIDKLVAGLKLGDAGRITDAFLRSPEELKAMIAVLTAPLAPLAMPPKAPVTVPIATVTATRVFA